MAAAVNDNAIAVFGTRRRRDDTKKKKKEREEKREKVVREEEAGNGDEEDEEDEEDIVELAAAALRKRKRDVKVERKRRETAAEGRLKEKKKRKRKERRGEEEEEEEVDYHSCEGTDAERRRRASMVEATALLRKASRIRIHPKHAECPTPITAFDDVRGLLLGENRSTLSRQRTASDMRQPQLALFDAIMDSMHANFVSITTPSPIQQQAIPLLLEKRDAMCVAPTGSGKTLAFLIPMLLLLGEPAKTINKRRKEEKFVGDDDAHASIDGRSAAGDIHTHRGACSSSVRGPRGLVVCPTRELAGQIHRVLRTLISVTTRTPPSSASAGASTLPTATTMTKDSTRGWRVQLVAKKTVAGVSWDLVDIAVGTPARIVAGIEKKTLLLDNVQLLILDEADKLFESTNQRASRTGNENDHAKKTKANTRKDTKEEEEEEVEEEDEKTEGMVDTSTFLSQLDRILSACTHPKRKCALFTATLPEGVEVLAHTILDDDLVRVTVGERNTAVNNIMQTLVYCGKTEKEKLQSLRSLLNPRHTITSTITNVGNTSVSRPKGIVPPVLIFTQSKERAQQLYLELRYDDGIKIGLITADRSETQRAATVDAFRAGEVWLLICTDLLARGMDFSSVQTVISYDFPTTTTAYIHRVGRAGRGGREGCQAITLFTNDDVNYGLVRPVAQVIKNSGNSVPEWLLQVEPARSGGSRDGGGGKGKNTHRDAGGRRRRSKLVAPPRRPILDISSRGRGRRRTTSGGHSKHTRKDRDKST